jgi:hypothetical protein
MDMEGNLDHVKLTPGALDDAIDDFLGDYELLAAAYRNGLINEEMAEDAFSYEFEKALRDGKVRHYWPGPGARKQIHSMACWNWRETGN